MAGFRSIHSSGLASAKRRLLSRIVVVTAVLVPAGTAVALLNSGGSSASEPANDSQGSLNINIEQRKSQITTSPSASSSNASQPSQSASSSSVSQHTVISTSSDGKTVSTQAKVNGHNIPIPDDGTIHKVIKDDSGQTTIDVSSSGDQASNDSSSSTLNMNISSSSKSSTGSE